MQEPSVRTSRLAIAGGLAAAIGVATVGFLVGRATVPPPPPVAPARVQPVAAQEPAPDTTRLLARGDLIAAATQAADALASGKPVPQTVNDLPARRFSLSLPFGCAGPAGADSPAPLRWSYDDAAQALRVHVALIRWQPDEWGLKPEDAGVPQGFWVTRPWSSAESCPAASANKQAIDTQPVILPGQTLAVVNFGSDAAGNQGGYDAVVRIARDKLDMAQGLRARISGRIGHVPGDGAVRCVQPAGIEQQPICAVAAIFDEMTIDNPATGETIATWSLGKAGESANSASR